MSRLADEIVASLEHEAGRWKFALCTLEREDGLQIWRASFPILDTQIWSPQKIELNFADKVKIYLAMRRWKANIPLTALGLKP